MQFVRKPQFVGAAVPWLAGLLRCRWVCLTGYKMRECTNAKFQWPGTVEALYPAASAVPGARWAPSGASWQHRPGKQLYGHLLLCVTCRR